jgi:hypothetical protein
VLARTTTLYDLLELYPFLERFLAGRHPVFERLSRTGSGRRWTRVTTLDSLATSMDLPRLELLREIQSEVKRVTGSSPVIAGVLTGPPNDERLGGEVLDVVRELESGATIAQAAARLEALTQGLDAEGVAKLARERDRQGSRVNRAAGAAGRPDGWPAAPAALHPGHPVRSLQQEGARLEGLAGLIDELVDGLGDPPDDHRWAESRTPLRRLLERLREMERQARRLRLAWYPPVASRVGASVPVLVSARLDEAREALQRLIVMASGEDVAAIAAQARAAMALLRRALAAEEELLVPAALSALDDDDWEVVAEQERVVGWALDPSQAV